MARVVRSSVGHWEGKKLSISERETKFLQLSPPSHVHFLSHLLLGMYSLVWKCPPLCCSLKTKNGNRRKNPFITWYSAIHRPKTGRSKPQLVAGIKTDSLTMLQAGRHSADTPTYVPFLFFFFQNILVRKKNFFFFYSRRGKIRLNGFTWCESHIHILERTPQAQCPCPHKQGSLEKVGC